MLTLKVETDVPLPAPNLQCGLITRLAITICESAAPRSRSIGSAQFALIHCAASAYVRVRIGKVMAADSADLSALYQVFFEKNWIKGRYESCCRADVIYVEALELQPEARGRNVEQAVVRRVFDTFGGHCAIGVMDLRTPEDLASWEALGFERVEAAEAMSSGSQFLVMDLSEVHPSVVELEGQENTFELVDALRGKDEDGDDEDDDEDEDEDDEDDDDEDDEDDDQDDDDEDDDDQDDGPDHGHA